MYTITKETLKQIIRIIFTTIDFELCTKFTLIGSNVRLCYTFKKTCANSFYPDVEVAGVKYNPENGVKITPETAFKTLPVKKKSFNFSRIRRQLYFKYKTILIVSKINDRGFLPF